MQEIIYALTKTVCNNTNIFVKIKTHGKYDLYAQLYKSTREIIYALMKTVTTYAKFTFIQRT